MSKIKAELTIFPLRDRLFQLGLLLRFFLILFAFPLLYSELFLPFFQNGLDTNPLDPWYSHLSQGGDLRAFPYGLTMYLVTFPLVAIGSTLDYLTGLQFFASISLGLTVLLFDLVLLYLLLKLRPKRQRAILSIYWLSPILLFICYWHGQLDIVPVVFLMLSLRFIFKHQPAFSGAMLAAAISAKLSMVIAGPIILLYLWLSRRRRPMLPSYLLGGAIVTFLLQAPMLLSSAGRNMVLGTPEIGKIYDFSITLSDEFQIFLVPVVYFLMLFALWQIHRINAQLLTAALGLAFLIIVLMTPASPGWYLWFVPFLVLHFVERRLRLSAFFVLYGFLFVGFQLLNTTGANLPAFGIDLSAPWRGALLIDSQFFSLYLSLLFSSGLILCFLLLRESVLRNDYYRLSRRPLLISIAGDSGAGKDTLANSLIDVLGQESTTHISGDDYHLWDRHKPMWQVMTHLNPRANNLLALKSDILKLARGMPILNPHYDHKLGRMTKPRGLLPNDVIIASGLHTLYDPELNNRCDVRVFLDMDDDLRRYLKIQRDVHERGHLMQKVSKALESRQSDRERFILPQANNTDLVMKLMPLNPEHIRIFNNKSGMPRLQLSVLLTRGTPYVPLVRTLVGVCGIHVEVIDNHHSEPVKITLEGDLDAEDVKMAASQYKEILVDLLTPTPQWYSGTGGLMQLFVINQIAHALNRRIQ